MRRIGLGARLAVLAVAIAFVPIVSGACADDGTPQPCTGIPEGGCPLSHGVACEDPACRAVYFCLPNNVWQLDQLCPPLEGGARDADIPDASVADHDAGSPLPSASDAAIDAPPGAFGGPGCEELQMPDCSVGLALACGGGCCGCEDLFVCNQGGWDLWGACRDGGVVRTP
jgi:hypothetical protein